MVHQGFIHPSRGRNDLARSRFDYRSINVDHVTIAGKCVSTFSAGLVSYHKSIPQGGDCFLGLVFEDNGKRRFFGVESEIVPWRRFGRVLKERTEFWES